MNKGKGGRMYRGITEEDLLHLPSSLFFWVGFFPFFALTLPPTGFKQTLRRAFVFVPFPFHFPALTHTKPRVLSSSRASLFEMLTPTAPPPPTPHTRDGRSAGFSGVLLRCDQIGSSVPPFSTQNSILGLLVHHTKGRTCCWIKV